MVRNWVGRRLIGIGFLICTEGYINHLIAAIRTNPYQPDRIMDAWEGKPND